MHDACRTAACRDQKQKPYLPESDTHITDKPSHSSFMRRTSADYQHAVCSPCLQDEMVAPPELTVYHAAPTRSSRVVLLLEELALPYKAISVDFPNELFTPDFLKANPMGTCADAHMLLMAMHAQALPCPVL